MFSHELAQWKQDKAIDLRLLQRKFDLAMTKKLAVIRLPPAFWMRDPKINPSSEQLFQVALLLGDAERCRLAISALAVEIAEHRNKISLFHRVEAIAAELLQHCPTDAGSDLELLARHLLQEING